MGLIGPSAAPASDGSPAVILSASSRLRGPLRRTLLNSAIFLAQSDTSLWVFLRRSEYCFGCCASSRSILRSQSQYAIHPPPTTMPPTIINIPYQLMVSSLQRFQAQKAITALPAS